MTEPLSTGILQHVDPNELQVEANVRTEASLTKQFIASIKENGVLVPIVAVRDEDGTLRVRMGQRRTLAAREAGLKEVPVYVTGADSGTATRLVEQITENDQRLALRGTDRVTGIQALLDTGLSVTKVAKRLAVSTDRVKQSKAVAGSAVAMDALHQRVATLAEAAGIAEFEDDPDAVQRLLRAAERNYFDHELQRMRDLRKVAKVRAKAAAEYTALGYEVLDTFPGFGGNKVPLNQLLDGNKTVDESVVTDPKQWAVILTEGSVFTDKDGNRIGEETIDWNTEADRSAEPMEGMVHADSIEESTEFVPEFYCRDLEGTGLIPCERWAKLAGASKQLPDGVEPETSTDLAEKAARKAERKKVIALNHSGASSEEVRREFVSGMLKRKTPPKGAMLFVAQQLTETGMLLGGHRGDEVAGELLGASVRTGELLDHANDHRAEVILLGLTLGALESLTPKSAWRGSSKESAAYLRFLAENGYELSPVEQVVTGDKTADECLEELA